MSLLRQGIERTAPRLSWRHRAAASLLNLNANSATTTPRRARPFSSSHTLSSSSSPKKQKNITDEQAKAMLNKISSSKSPYVLQTVPTSLDLPPTEKWGSTFKFSEKRKRKTLCNPETAKKLAELLVPEGSKDKIIVEAYSGPGLLTRALLDLPKERIKKLIVIEEEPVFREWLEPLRRVDDRVHIIPEDAFWWTTYSKMEEDGILDGVETHDWSVVHPNLQFIAQIPNNVHGEQLIAQLIRAIPDRKWFFRYGRVPLDLLTTASMWARLASPPKDYKFRTKVGVIAQAIADLSSLVPPQDLEPVQDHFFYPSKRERNQLRQSKVADMPQQHARVVPLEHGAIAPDQLDVWDYVARQLMITKATPISKCISALGPGANSLLKKLTDPELPPNKRVDVKKSPRDLTTEDWKNVVDVFDDWPFRPERLSIDTAFMGGDER